MISYLIRKNKPYVIELEAVFILPGRRPLKITFSLRGGKTKGSHGVITAVNAYTGRIRADCRNVPSKSSHGAAHSDKTGCPFQSVIAELHGVIYILRPRPCHDEER